MTDQDFDAGDEVSSRVASLGNADEKMKKRLQRQQTLDEHRQQSLDEPEAVPVWLMNAAPETTGTETTTEDIQQEFAEDEDMCQLEKQCSRWRGVSDSDLEDFAKMFPEIADTLRLATEHVSEFLSYRRTLKEKFAHKAEVQNNMKQKTLAFDAVSEESDSEDDLTDKSKGDDAPVSGATAEDATKKEDAQAKPARDAAPQLLVQPPQETPRKSQQLPGRTSASPVFTSPRLAQAGNAIVGATSAQNSRRPSVVQASGQNSRRPSLVQMQTSKNNSRRPSKVG